MRPGRDAVDDANARGRPCPPVGPPRANPRDAPGVPLIELELPHRAPAARGRRGQTTDRLLQGLESREPAGEGADSARVRPRAEPPGAADVSVGPVAGTLRNP